MQVKPPPYTIYALGDMALSIDFGNKIDSCINQYVLTLFHQLEQLAFPFIRDVVPAYSSLTIHYDILQVLNQAKDFDTVFEAMSVLVENVISIVLEEQNEISRCINIPVCYSHNYGPDLQSMALAKGLSVEEIIAIHTGKHYRVYMIGFLPGFPYMGEVDEQIAVPRKEQPRLQVEKGAVGIAGRQTGIYPQVSPGGWQIIGRTPVSLFNPNANEPTLLKPGDSVQFYSITENEFTHYKGWSA